MADWLPDIQRAILGALRQAQIDGERHDYYMIAATLGEPAFRVRAELKKLRGDQLVRECLTRSGHTWELTNRGERLAWGQLQTEMQH